MDHIILALDLSMQSPGYAVMGIDKGSPVILEKGHLKTNAKLGNGGRLDQIARWLDGILYQYPIEAVIREKGFSRFPATTQALFRVVGVSDLYAYKHGHTKVIELSPTTVKKIIAGTGKAEKEEVENAVRSLLNLPDSYSFKSNDESDAVAVGLAYYLQEKKIILQETG